MKNRIEYTLFTFLLLVSALGYGQVEFKTKVSTHKLGLNERLKVEFEMNRNGDDFDPPNFKDFDIYSGPSQYMEQRFINGKRSFSKTYTFFVVPKKRGKLTIGQATVSINGKTYKTSPVQIEVTAPVDKPKDEEGNDIVDISDKIHLVAEVSKNKPYENEGITVTYKLYVRRDQGINGMNLIDAPKFPGFWSQEIHSDQKLQVGSYKGDDNYRFVTLQQFLLYPQKSGKLEIQPLTLELTVSEPTHRRDFFGGIIYKPVTKRFSSNPITLDVKSLPTANQPDDFSGAVGDLNFQMTASKGKLEAGESLDIKLIASGRGNLKLFQLPKLKVPGSFELYDPEHNENVRGTMGGMTGRITDTYTVVPDAEGDFTIGPVQFSYFDPKSGTYKRRTAKPIDIKVEGGAPRASSSGQNNADSTHFKRQVTAAKSHFDYIKLRTKLSPVGKSSFLGSVLFWALFLLPFLLLPLIIFWGKKRQKRAGDVHGRRIKKANKLAKKYLSEAKRNMGQQQIYYESLERALHNYLKSRLDMPTTEMSKPKIKETLQNRGVTQETSDEFVGLLESCEFARYTPVSDVSMQQDYNKASTIISQVDKELKA